MTTNNIIKIVSGLILAFLLFLVILEFKEQPNFTYKLQTFEKTQNVQEQPMEVTMEPDKKGLSFKVIFTDDRANSEKAKLALKYKFQQALPFLTYSDELTVQLINADQIAAEDQVIYEVSGKITGLKAGVYKLKVVDPNSNLVDEKVVTLE